MSRPATHDHLKSKKSLRENVEVILDPEVLDAYTEAKAAYDIADGPAKRKAEKALAEAREALDDVTVNIVVKSIGRVAYERLVDEHPPTEEQKERQREQQGFELPWNDETFSKALFAACVVEPKLTAEDVDEMWDSDEWNMAELRALSTAAFNVNNTRRVSELGKDSGSTTG